MEEDIKAEDENPRLEKEVITATKALTFAERYGGDKFAKSPLEEEATRMLAKYGITGDPIAGLKTLCLKYDNARQHMLWAVEERSRHRKRIAMLEAALDGAIVDLRLTKAAGGIVSHHERTLKERS